MPKSQSHKQPVIRYAQISRSTWGRIGSGFAPTVFLVFFLSSHSAGAGNVWGNLQGVTLDATGRALSGVQVTLVGLDEHSQQTVVSGSEGTFEVSNLNPGRYELTGHKTGFVGTPPVSVLMIARHDQRIYLILIPTSRPAPPASPADSPHGTDVAGSPEVARSSNVLVPAASAVTPPERRANSNVQILQELEAMKQRISELEAQLADRTPPVSGAVPSATGQKPDAPAAAPSALTAARVTTRPALPQVQAGVPEKTARGPANSGQSSLIAMNAPPEYAPSLSPVSEQTEGTSGERKPAVAAIPPPQATAVAQAPATTPPAPSKIEPFSDADWTWLNGNPRTKDIFWDTKFFTPEIRADMNYTYDFNHPTDHTMGGSSEIFRTNEVQVTQLGVGGDFHYDNVRARLMTQFGMYSQTPRNDASPGHGQWDLDTAYRYVSEAYGGYHFNVLHGINVDAGIFVSYIGLFSYYNFDNWAYQPSYVSSNTPWFFNGVRVQIYPTAHLKIEPWFINGWQSYASPNHRPGLGGQVKWTPKPWINVISNNYGLGHDDLFIPARARIHTDNSVEVKYYDRPASLLDKMAFSLTGDLGCEFGSGVSCHGNTRNGPKQSFAGYMAYNRFWFKKDRYGLTVGGGQINNPGRYLVLIPPINGQTAVTAATNSPYFTENPGDPFKAWDSSITFDWMPKQYITFRWEYSYRHASVPYWSGAGGITPPGGNNGYPTEYACMNGSPSLTIGGCASNGGLWTPDLRRDESFIDIDILVKF